MANYNLQWLWLSLLVFLFIASNILCDQFKCREDVRNINSVCTIDCYSGDNLNNVQLHPNHKDYVIYLKFNNCTLHFIPPDIFKEFKKIVNLDMSNCHLHDVRSQTFTSASKLTSLTLSRNDLSELHESQFVGSNNLMDIDLSHNQIERVDKDAFKNLKKLQKIDLSYNKLVNLPTIVAFATLNLQEINLNNNQLQGLNFRAKHCGWLRADNNFLDSDSLTIENIASVTLRNNLMTNLNFLRNNNNLSYLDLSSNQLRFNNVTDRDVLKSCAKLKTLILKSVNFTKLDTGIFPALPVSLEMLDISSNNLERIDLNLLSQLENLRQLYINDNQLRNPTFIGFEYLFPNLSLVDISDNSWQCDNLIATLKQLKQFGIKVHTNKTKRYPNETSIRGISCSNNNPSNKTNDTDVKIKIK